MRNVKFSFMKKLGEVYAFGADGYRVDVPPMHITCPIILTLVLASPHEADSADKLETIMMRLSA